MPQVVDMLADFKHRKETRKHWEEHWQDIAEVMLPRHADFTRERVDGEKLNERVFDSTPMMARRGLSSAIDGLLKPKTSRWFGMKTRDDKLNERESVKLWFREVENRMWRSIYNPAARFIQRTGEVDDHLVSFGTGVLFIDEGRSLNRLKFQSIPLKDAYISENGDGDIDTLHIQMKISAKIAVQRWGEENLSRDVNDAATDPKSKKIEFLQTIAPRPERDRTRRDNRNFPFASTIINIKEESIVTDGGFAEFPCAVPRWDTSSGELYGRSPGMLALPDSNTLQAMAKTILVAGQKAADPPLLAPSDSIVGAMRTFPGGITYYDAEALENSSVRQPIGPLQTGANIPIAREMQNDTRGQIWAAFFRNVLDLPQGGPQMTATEVIARREEFLRGIGPVFGRLESDYITKIAERVFNIMFAAGAFPEMPEELRGQTVDFVFQSPVEKARKQIEAAGIARSLELIQPFADRDPAVMDNFDADKIARDSRDIFSMPPEWIRPVEEVEQIRSERRLIEGAQTALAGADTLAGISEKQANARSKG